MWRWLEWYLFPRRVPMELPYAEMRRRLRALRAGDEREVAELERMVRVERLGER